MPTPERRFYASSVIPESAEIMAKLGFGVLVVTQNKWAIAAEDIHRYGEIATSVGFTPVLQRDTAFKLRDAAPEVTKQAEGIFAPA
jgi:hypothetical protein